MNKRFLIIAAAVVVGIAGFLYLTRPSTDSVGTPSNHQYSQGSSGIVLMEYGDFQCPACGAYFPIVSQIKEEYKELITFQFRNLPLEQLHLNARAAARAAEAANKQGKYWEMHDQLFQTQQAWGESKDPISIFASYAAALGMNVDQFKTDLASTEVNGIINADIAEFNKTGEPKSTPTFFIDGKAIQPDGTVAGFQKLLNDALTAKGIQPPATAATPAPVDESTQQITPSTENGQSD